MLSTVLLNALSFLPQGGTGTSTAPVVINEFNYDDSSTDDLEFIELYNRTSSPVDISGWSLVGDDSNGINFTEVFPAGTIIAPGGYFVLGDTGVPNVNIVRASGFLQNSNESITLFDGAAAIVDTLIYEANKGVFNPALAEGEGIWGNFSMSESNKTTLSRLRDGFDTNNNGNDFRIQPWSPGASNNLPAATANVETFDGLTIADPLAGWQGSFVDPTVIDPTLFDTNNPYTIPASPQGGLAIVAWDSAGGGNHTMQLADPGVQNLAEAYVYIESVPLPLGESEMWSFGFGTSGTFFNFPDPTGALGFSANGDTGFVWTYVRDDVGATLYLMDRNDGGMGTNALTAPVVVGSIPVTAGVNDGWQRVKIEINGTSAEGRFGGTYGAADGTAFTATVDRVDRGLYASYREGVTGTTGARPFTMDFLFSDTIGAAYTRAYGTGCDGLTLDATGLPALGNAGFALNVNNALLPVATIGFGSMVVEPGIDLTPVGMAGCFGYTNLDIGLFSTGPVVGGTGSFGLPIPTNPALVGSAMSAQGIALGGTNLLGLAASNGLELVFGL